MMYMQITLPEGLNSPLRALPTVSLLPGRIGSNASPYFVWSLLYPYPVPKAVPISHCTVDCCQVVSFLLFCYERLAQDSGDVLS
jgi:hypothetical protein